MSTASRSRGLRRAVAALALAAALPLGACTIGDSSGTAVDRAGDRPAAGREDSGSDGAAPDERGDGSLPAGAKDPAAEASSRTAATSAREPSPGDLGALRGAVIALDPGHAGTAPPADQMVTDGRGGMKQCNTTGTASNAGWPEHTFNWVLAQRIKKKLEAAGATVLLSRADDTGRAACIDERTETENASDADVVVSIHADGNGEGARGFHVSAIADPLPGNLAEESSRLAADLRDAMVAQGFQTSNYLGVDGLNPRSDLTGLNLSTKPKALMEFGNMRDSQDIALLESEDGQERMAQAMVEGINDYLSENG
ncbi:N-acetylmuramoyl-L-alanine amidase [Corynebacterium sp. 335C]